MRAFLISILLLLTTLNCSSQEKLNFNKNTILFETGLFSRGIVGISYSRNYLKSKMIFLNTDFSVGAGANIGGFSAYITLGQFLNIGSDQGFLILGFEGKYYNVILDAFLFQSGTQYQGFTASPLLGAGFAGDSGFTFKFKCSVLPIFDGCCLDRIRPAFGLSFGYSF